MGSWTAGDDAADMYIIVEGRVQERFELQHPAQPQSTKGEMLNAALPSLRSQSSLAPNRLLDKAREDAAAAEERAMMAMMGIPCGFESTQVRAPCEGQASDEGHKLIV